MILDDKKSPKKSIQNPQICKNNEGFSNLKFVMKYYFGGFKVNFKKIIKMLKIKKKSSEIIKN